MSEFLHVADAWIEARSRGRAGALATVIRTHGSTFRRPGARMLILDDGTTVGSVSGGCLESSIIDSASEVIGSGRSKTLRYDGTKDDVVLGEGAMCDGEVAICVERVDDELSHGFEHLIDSIEEDDVQIVVEDDETRGPVTRVGAARAREIPDERVLFRERVLAPLRLVLCGAGALADAVGRLGRSVGWDPVVVDHRPHFLAAMAVPTKELREASQLGELLDRPSRTAVVVMTHHYERDIALVGQALRTGPLYVGLLGSRGRSKRLVDELKERLGELDLSRLHAPVGLEIGSETIEEIALSIVAEIQAVRTGAGGGFLRESDRPVHGKLSARIAGVVLAAGGSTRMGRQKLVLEGTRGKSLIQETFDKLRALELSDLVVVEGADATIGELAREAGARVVVNDDWKKGLGSSLREAIASLAEDIDAALVVLGDQPRISESELEALVARWRRSDAPVAATRYEEGGGVPAVFGRELFGELRRLEGDRGAREMIRALEDVELVEVADARDVDDPADYRDVVGRSDEL